MAKYSIEIEHEGHVGTVEAASDAEAVEAAETFIAGGEYDLADGEEYVATYWLTREDGERGDSRTVTLIG